MSNIDIKSVNTIRVLSADGIEKAKSGHPGLPLGAAPIAYELFAHHMKHNPKNPDWKNRDRFILSAGHGSMLLYSLFHLFGYGDLSLDDLKSFSCRRSARSSALLRILSENACSRSCAWRGCVL